MRKTCTLLGYCDTVPWYREFPLTCTGTLYFFLRSKIPDGYKFLMYKIWFTATSRNSHKISAATFNKKKLGCYIQNCVTSYWKVKNSNEVFFFVGPFNFIKCICRIASVRWSEASKCCVEFPTFTITSYNHNHHDNF